MDKIDEILELLAARSSSFSLDEVSRSVSIPYDVCEKIVQFLAEYGFVRMNGLKVKISPETRKFIVATFEKTPLQLITSSATDIVKQDFLVKAKS